MVILSDNMQFRPFFVSIKNKPKDIYIVTGVAWSHENGEELLYIHELSGYVKSIDSKKELSKHSVN
jgi:hypothetical protein